MDARRWNEGRGAPWGYSFPELLIVIAFIGLFVLFGGPALSEAFRSYKVRATANNLVSDIKAVRYLAVTNRAPQTLTLNRMDHVSAPNQYSYANARGQTVTVGLQGVNIETGSATSVPFSINGSTGSAGNTTVVLSWDITNTRGERYTITVSPTGTVSSAFTTYTP